MNKCRAPKIPLLLVNNLFILISSVKARYTSITFFHNSVHLLSITMCYYGNSVHLLSITVCYPFLPFCPTNKRFDYVTVENKEILSLVRNVNPNKATGSDGISGQMLLLCDDAVS